eukprot:Sspe_Gene.47791::Locus_24542_Transcript_1_1_Confidence_1.000_Length_3311::g.47791::m.47791
MAGQSERSLLCLLLSVSLFHASLAGLCRDLPASHSLRATATREVCELVSDLGKSFQLDHGMPLNLSCGDPGPPPPNTFLRFLEDIPDNPVDVEHPWESIAFAVHPVAVVFNVPGLNYVVLSHEALLGIFSARITMWDDPLIALHNPQRSLPHVQIRLVVRGGNILDTQVLASVVGPSFPPPNASVVGSTAELAKEVMEQPFSISYLSMADTLTQQLRVALLLNSIGGVTAPRVEDITQMESANDYPLVKRVVLAINGNPADGSCAEWCALGPFIDWLVASGVPEVIGFRHFVRLLPEQYGREALKQLWKGSCWDGTRWGMKAHVYKVDKASADLLSKLWFSYAATHQSDHLLVFEHDNSGDHGLEHEGEGFQDKFSQEHFHTSATLTTYFSVARHVPYHQDGYDLVPFALGQFVIIANLGGAVPYHLALTYPQIRKLLDGTIVHWKDIRLGYGNSLVPYPDLPVQVFASSVSKGSPFGTLCGLVACRKLAAAVVTDSVGMVRDTPGAVAVATSFEIGSFPFSQVHPWLPDGIKESGKLARTALPMRSNDNGYYVETSHSYPFTFTISFAIQTQNASCDEQQHVYDFVRYGLHMNSTRAIWEMGMEQLLPSVRWEDLSCDGRQLYPPDSTSDEPVPNWLVGLLAGGTVFVTIGYVFHARRTRSNLGQLMSTADLAAACSEACASLSFDELAFLEDIENPSRLQVAFRSIVSNMLIFIKYVPHHVILQARGVVLDSPEEDYPAVGETFSVDSSVSQSTFEDAAPRRESQSTAGIYAGSRRLLKGGERQKRTVVVMVLQRVEQGDLMASYDMHKRFVAKAVDLLTAYMGLVQRVTEDYVVGSWGAIAAKSLQKTKCLRASLAVLEEQEVAMSGGLQLGSAVCEMLTTSNVRFFSTSGLVMEEAHKLSYAATACGVRMLVGRALVSDSELSYRYAPFIDIVGSRRRIKCSLFLGAKEYKEQGEWMYEIEGAGVVGDSSDYVADIMSLALGERYIEALEIVNELDPTAEAYHLMHALSLVFIDIERGSLPALEALWVTHDYSMYSTHTTGVYRRVDVNVHGSKRVVVTEV